MRSITPVLRWQGVVAVPEIASIMADLATRLAVLGLITGTFRAYTPTVLGSARTIRRNARQRVADCARTTALDDIRDECVVKQNS